LAKFSTDQSESHFTRFKEAFVKELQVFTDCVLDDKPPHVNLHDALQASKITTALTLAFHTGQYVYFDEEGEIIAPK
jgi:myo-inositol 2-dehydrogenase/D-chiro-inositol 1-dehydrogenase